VIHYLRDMAEGFVILFGAYVQALAGGTVALGMFLAIYVAFISQIRRGLR